MHLAVDRVGVDVEGIELQRVGMHIERVLLRIVFHERLACGVAIACLVVIEQVVAKELVLVHRVFVDHIAEAFVQTRRVVVEQTVASDGLLLVHDGGAAKQLREVGLRVEIAVGGVDDVVARHDLRRACDVSQRCAGVVEQGVGVYDIVVAPHAHIVEEGGLTALRVILSPVAHQLVLAVDELAALEEVGVLVDAVIVETVGVERLRAVLEHHVMAGAHHLLLAVILAIVAGE